MLWSAEVGIAPPSPRWTRGDLLVIYRRISNYRTHVLLSAIFICSPLYIPAPISSILSNGMTGTVKRLDMLFPHDCLLLVDPDMEPVNGRRSSRRHPITAR